MSLHIWYSVYFIYIARYIRSNHKRQDKTTLFIEYIIGSTMKSILHFKGHKKYKTRKLKQSYKNKNIKRKYPKKYIPSYLSKQNAETIKKEIDQSQHMYNRKSNKKYHIRKHVATMKVKPSKHVVRAKKLYDVSSLHVNKELVKKTGCKAKGLHDIIRKGKGAYFTGSRPGQTPSSWGFARLASAITGQKSAAVDFHILHKYCNHRTSKAYKLALKARQKHGKGTRKVPKRLI
jgi:hypothetical protein